MNQHPTLLQCLAEVPECRQAQGRRHPLVAILTLTVVAMLGGRDNVSAIAELGRTAGKEYAALLGFTHYKTPCVSTLCACYQSLDLDALEAAISKWLLPMLPRTQRLRLSLDGKTLRGTRSDAMETLHLITAFAHDAGIVLAQDKVPASTNEHKAALELLNILPVEDSIILGDAAFSQRDLSRSILDKGGDFIWPVKDNQPELLKTVKALFHHPFSPSAELLRA